MAGHRLPYMDVLLEARHVFRRHPDDRSWLLDDVSLALQAGDRLVLVGPSGAGKTLLLRTLAKLDPLDKGEVLFAGHPIRHDGVPQFRASALYLHQRAALIADTVEAALEHPYRLHAHRQQRYDRGRAVELLTSLARDAAFLQKTVGDLSGGEIQITALVRALQLNPRILLLDEPTAALDGPTATMVERLIGSWLDEDSHRAMVWVSHNHEQARRVGRSIGTMESGRLVDLQAADALR